RPPGPASGSRGRSTTSRPCSSACSSAGSSPPWPPPWPPTLASTCWPGWSCARTTRCDQHHEREPVQRPEPAGLPVDPQDVDGRRSTLFCLIASSGGAGLAVAGERVGRRALATAGGGVGGRAEVGRD